MDTGHLPIRQHAADILKAVEQTDVVVVIGETGSGKTTQLSQVRGWIASTVDTIKLAKRVSYLFPTTCRSCWRLDTGSTA
jgi:ATP-dependent RNA helicase DHX8/PRP22